MAIIKKLTCRWKFACVNCLRNNDIYYGGLIRFIYVVDRNIFVHRKRTKIFYANITQCNGNFSVSSSTSPRSNLTDIVHQETVTEEALLTAPPFLRGVKDWVHMKTVKMMQDFTWLCNLDVNHKLFLIFIIKVVYLCTLHNKLISPAHFVVYVLWRPTPT